MEEFRVARNVQFLYAFDINLKRHVYVDEASRGREYACGACHNKMCFKQGTKIGSHFAHFPGATCDLMVRKGHDGSEGESVQHCNAKMQIASILEHGSTLHISYKCKSASIVGETCCGTSNLKLREGQKVKLEHRVQDVVLDVAVVDSNGELVYAIEVIASHRSNAEPRESYEWYEVRAPDTVVHTDSQDPELACVRVDRTTCERCTELLAIRACDDAERAATIAQVKCGELAAYASALERSVMSARWGTHYTPADCLESVARAVIDAEARTSDAGRYSTLAAERAERAAERAREVHDDAKGLLERILSLEKVREERREAERLEQMRREEERERREAEERENERKRREIERIENMQRSAAATAAEASAKTAVDASAVLGRYASKKSQGMSWALWEYTSGTPVECLNAVATAVQDVERHARDAKGWALPERHVERARAAHEDAKRFLEQILRASAHEADCAARTAREKCGELEAYATALEGSTTASWKRHYYNYTPDVCFRYVEEDVQSAERQQRNADGADATIVERIRDAVERARAAHEDAKRLVVLIPGLEKARDERRAEELRIETERKQREAERRAEELRIEVARAEAERLQREEQYRMLREAERERREQELRVRGRVCTEAFVEWGQTLCEQIIADLQGAQSVANLKVAFAPILKIARLIQEYEDTGCTKLISGDTDGGYTDHQFLVNKHDEILQIYRAQLKKLKTAAFFSKCL